MSQSQLQGPESIGMVTEVKKIKPLKAYAILASFTIVIFILGIVVGKAFFWNNYNKTPMVDRLISTNLEKVKINPKDPKALTDLGWSYFQKGDYNQALTYYKQALDQDKNYYPAHLNKGLTFQQVKKYDMAIEAFKTAISLSPKSAIARINLGAVYNQSKKYQEAEAELKAADQASPGNVEIMYQLGFAYEGLQKYKEAFDQYTAALRYNPKYVPAQQGLDRVKDKVPKS